MTEKRQQGEDDFASLLEEFEREQGQPERGGPKPGDTVRGTVVAIGRDKVFVDLGGRSEATLDLDDVRDDEGTALVSEGDVVEARVVAAGKDGAVALRRSLGRGPEAAAELEDAFAAGVPVEGLVTASNKGGFDVQIAGLRGFCPISQIDQRYTEDPEAHVGKRYQFRITKFEGGRRPNIVVSRRALLEEEARERAAELRQNLAPGSVLSGTVTTLKPYGAFVDLGGLEGLVHVSELSYHRVDDPAEVLREGQTVDVKVLAIDRAEQGRAEQGRAEQAPGAPRSKKNAERISLSMRALKEDPWAEQIARLREGGRVGGRVVKLEAFGAFVEIAPGVEGLVHVSEIPSNKRLSHARQALSLGDTVEVVVKAIDREQRRISLSIKAAADAADAERREGEPREHKEAQGLGTFADLLKGKLGGGGSSGGGSGS